MVLEALSPSSVTLGFFPVFILRLYSEVEIWTLRRISFASSDFIPRFVLRAATLMIDNPCVPLPKIDDFLMWTKTPFFTASEGKRHALASGKGTWATTISGHAILFSIPSSAPVETNRSPEIPFAAVVKQIFECRVLQWSATPHPDFRLPEMEVSGEL